jgi:hypothetical protein
MGFVLLSVIIYGFLNFKKSKLDKKQRFVFGFLMLILLWGFVAMIGPRLSLNGKYLGIPLKAGWDAWSGYANYGKNSFTVDKWSKVSDYKSVQPSDFFFLAPNQNGAGGVGHVGIIAGTPDAKGNVKVIDQNWDGKGNRERIVNISKINGVLRPKV